MAASIVQSTGADTGGVAGSGYTMTFGATPSVGNVLVAFIENTKYSPTHTITTPSGTWNAVTAFTSTSGNSIATTYWHAVTGGDGTAYAFSYSGSTQPWSGAIYEITGTSTTAPINNSNAGNFAQSSPMTSASVTPSVLSCLPLVGFYSDSYLTALSTITSGWTGDQQRGMTGAGNSLVTGHQNAVTTDTSTAISAAITVTGYPGPGASAILLIAPSSAIVPSSQTIVQQAVKRASLW